MKTCILAIQFPLSHAAIVLAFDVVDMVPDSGLAAVDDTTFGSGHGFSGSIYSRTSWCSNAIRVCAFQILQFDPLSLKHSMLLGSLASRWSVLEGGIMVSSNYSCYEFSFNELGS